MNVAVFDYARHRIGLAVDVFVEVYAANAHGIVLHCGHLLRIDAHLASGGINLGPYRDIAKHKSAYGNAVVGHTGDLGLTCGDHACGGVGQHLAGAGHIACRDFCLKRFTAISGLARLSTELACDV